MAELTEEEVKRRMADAQRRYLAAGHAVQTAVLFNMERGARSHEPKHLRTGLDMRAADAAGLARLLIKKGVFTELEYIEAMADAAEEEVARYTKDTREKTGLNVSFG